MKLLTGDELGFTKVVNVGTQRMDARYGIADKNLGVEFVKFTSGDEEQVVVGLKSGWIPVLATADGALAGEFNAGSKLAGMDVVGDKVIAVTTSGAVHAFELGVTAESREAPEPTCNIPFPPTRDTLTCASAAPLDSGKTWVAAGGKEILPVVVDYSSGEVVWAGKNVSADYLDLRIPVWPQAMTWVPASACGVTTQAMRSRAKGSDPVDPYVLVTISRHGHLRVWDVGGQRKALASFDLHKDGNTPLCCEVSHDKKSLFVGDAVGGIRRYSLSTGQHLAKFKGHPASVRSLSLHPTLPLLASGGLGRCVIIHNIESKTVTFDEYIKQCLNVVLWFKTEVKDATDAEKAAMAAEEAEEAEEEEVWVDMGGKKPSSKREVVPEAVEEEPEAAVVVVEKKKKKRKKRRLPAVTRFSV